MFPFDDNDSEDDDSMSLSCRSVEGRGVEHELEEEEDDDEYEFEGNNFVFHNNNNDNDKIMGAVDDDIDEYDSGEDDNDNYNAEMRSWKPDQVFKDCSYQNLGSPQDVEQRFLDYLKTSPSCQSSIQVLLESDSAVSRDYSLAIDVFDLMKSDPILGQMLIRFANTLLPILEKSIVRAQKLMQQEQQQRQQQQQQHQQQQQQDGKEKKKKKKALSVKGEKETKTVTRVHARLIHLPPMCCKSSLGSIEAKDMGTMVQLSGTVVRTSSVQMYECTRIYQCIMSRSNNSSNSTKKRSSGSCGCGNKFAVNADLDQYNNALIKPEYCTFVDKETKVKCMGTKLKQLPEESVHTDYQEIKIQEAASSVGIGHMPRSLLVKLQHDLVDMCQPGDEVIVVGSLLPQWQPSIIPEVDCNIGIALNAYSIRVVQEKNASSWKAQAQQEQTDSNDNNNTSNNNETNFHKEFEQYWRETPRNQTYPIAARDFICKAVCPKLYGLFIVKLGLLITLIGGVSSDAYNKQDSQDNDEDNDDGEEYNTKNDCHWNNDFEDDNDGPVPFQVFPQQPSQPQSSYGYDKKNNSDNNQRGGKQQNQPKRSSSLDAAAAAAAVQTRRRDQSHMLLVGDPGTGKSQILRFTAALCPRSVLTTGVGTTSAGLTCAAVREGNSKEFSLEAGALVLADNGVCCIDEFGCIQDKDRTTIHEAMEQQTLSVAKAGIVCKLNCRATILAVMNPKDSIYDNHTTLSRNTGLGTPLLSRFDLIFKLVDSSDSERDDKVSTYLLNRAIQGAGLDCSAFGMDDDFGNDKSGNSNNKENMQPEEDDDIIEETPWSMEKLRAYISILREKFQPVMSQEAAVLLERHYELIRSPPTNPAAAMSGNTTIPVTVRFLESLIRLSQAHARLMYRNVVTLKDAVAVLQVMECSAFAYGGFDGMDAMDRKKVLYCDPMTVDFEKQPDLRFLKFEHKILQRYKMIDYMSDDDRKMVESHWENGGNTMMGPYGTNAQNSMHDGWQNYENPRDLYHHQQVQKSHLQRELYSQGEMHDAIPPPPPATQTTITQDHYGRLHFSQSPKNNTSRMLPGNDWNIVSEEGKGEEETSNNHQRRKKKKRRK